MNKLKSILPILICVFTTQSFSQVLTLDSVLNRIEQNNPMLKMYDEQVNAFINYSKSAKAWMPPTISTGPSEAPYKNFNEGMWMISGTQMIPNPSKQKANANYMRSMGAVESEGRNAKLNEMFTMAKQNYYEWIIIKRKYDILLKTDALLAYIVEAAQLRYKFNKEKLNNIYKAQAELFELRNMEIMFMGDIKMKNVELNTLMNCDKNFVFDIDTTLMLKNYELQLLDSNAIVSQRSDVKQLDASVNMMRAQQEAERSKRLPEFGVSYSHMQSLNGMPNQFTAMGMVTIPIAPWSANEYKAMNRGLDNTVNATNFQKQSLVNETAGMIASLQTQIIATKNQITNYNSHIIPAYYKSYQTSLLAYEQNTEDLFVVLDGLKMYRMANMDMLDQLNSLLKLQTDYEKEMEIR